MVLLNLEMRALKYIGMYALSNRCGRFITSLINSSFALILLGIRSIFTRNSRQVLWYSVNNQRIQFGFS